MWVGIRYQDRTIEKDTSGFSSHLTKPSWSGMLKIECSLGDRLWRHNVPGKVLLGGLGGPQLHIIGVQALHVAAHGKWY